MPFLTNTSRGTVKYTTGSFSDSIILPNSTGNNNSGLAVIPEFTIPIAAYERVVLFYHLFTTADATGDLRVKIDAPASPDIYRAQLVSGGDEGTVTLASETHLDLTTDTANDIVVVKGLIHNGANAGDIKFSFSERADGAGVNVLGGSSLEYFKF